MGQYFSCSPDFHGLHVTIGAIMLWVIWSRVMKGHFTPKSYFAVFEGVAWYWALHRRGLAGTLYSSRFGCSRPSLLDPDGDQRACGGLDPAQAVTEDQQREQRDG